MRIVVLGFGTAGFSAVLHAKKEDMRSEVVVVEKRGYDTHSPCGIPYAVEGLIGFDDLRHTFPAERMNVEKLTGHEAIRINAEESSVVVRGKSGKETVLNYDSLVIATGARSSIPPIKGLERYPGKNVFTVRTIEDGEKIKSILKKGMKAIVIGGGLIGLEMAYALSQNGCHTTVVEIFPQIMPKNLDKDMARDVQRYLEEVGIEFKIGKNVLEVNGNKQALEVVLENEVIEGDIIVVSAGVKPNVELAEEAGIKTGKFGIITDRYMKTSVDSIYAAGDCASNKHRLTGRDSNVQLAPVAYRQGMVAGINAAGGLREYEGDQDASITRIGNIEIGFCGLNEYEARELGYEFIVSKIKGMDTEFLPSGEVKCKILCRKDGIVIGGQVIGKKVRERIAPLAIALYAGLDVQTLMDVDFGYAPLQAEYYDILNRCAEQAVRKLRRITH
jgi:NADH oxidase (H2O2-forming)